jgi:nucleotide-binding universal stress UspA family protein
MKILLPVDGSEHSLGAAGFLNNLNLAESDSIHILHVIQFVPIVHDIETYSNVIYNIKEELAPRIIEETKTKLKNIPATITDEVREGDVEKTIIDAAMTTEADLIVMGARGVKGLTSFIVGSTTRGVVLNSPIPVLAIKQKQWEIAPPLKVLFATDGSEYSDIAGRFLASIHFKIETEVTVLHVIQSPVHDIPERFFIEIDDRAKEEVAKIRTIEFSRAEKLLERTIGLLGDSFEDIKTITKVGDPSTEILSAAKNIGTDIIVTGCRGLKGLKGMLGSVSRNIMRHAECSFMIGKTC